MLTDWENPLCKIKSRSKSWPLHYHTMVSAVCVHVRQDVSEQADLREPENEISLHLLLLRLRRAHGMRSAGASELPVHTNRELRMPGRTLRTCNSGQRLKSFLHYFFLFAVWTCQKTFSSDNAQTLVTSDGEEERSLDAKKKKKGEYRKRGKNF